MNIRATAAQFLGRLIRGQTTLAAMPIKDHWSDPDKGLFQELCYGVCRHFFWLQDLANSLMRSPLREKDADLTALIYLGLYQLYLTRIPDYASLNATVEGAAELKKIWGKSMINGVLRNAQRQREHYLAQHAPSDHINHPRWLIERIQQDWTDNSAAIFKANNAHPPMTLRVNILKISVDDYLNLLQQRDMAANKTSFSSVGITLDTPVAVGQLPGFFDGWVSVQDEAAQLAAALLDLKPGLIVLDACSAPGGKTGHILETEPHLKTLIALDVEPHRLARVQDNLNRLNLNATLMPADAGQVEAWWDGQGFDRILLDTPCSGTGVIRRHPDIKLVRSAAEVDTLIKTQAHLLAKLWPCLNPGGLLVYATCSILKQENELQISAFLAQHPDATPVNIPVEWGIECCVGRQLLPQSPGHDGFYYAVLRKHAA